MNRGKKIIFTQLEFVLIIILIILLSLIFISHWQREFQKALIERMDKMKIYEEQ